MDHNLFENRQKLPSISFFCPAYHDEDNLPKLIPRVFKFLSEVSDKFEILIIEDGSPDKTGEAADKLASEFPYTKVIHHPKNLGYGATLKDGFNHAQYEYVMYTDGDNQYDIYDFKPYLNLLSSADVISGYAVKKAVTTARKVQSAVFNFLINLLFFVNLKDVNCSMKIFSRKVLDSMTIKSDSAFIDAEMLIKAKKAGFKIAQFPVVHYARQSGMPSGSKINVIAKTVEDMLKFRLGLL